MQNTEIDQLLNEQNEHIKKLHSIVNQTIKEEKLIIDSLLNPPTETIIR